MNNKRGVILFIILYLFAICMCSCSSINMSNKSISDNPYTHAIISLPDGSIVSGELDDYTFLSYDRCIVTIDGTQYMLHMNNVTLMCECVEDDFEDD